MGYNFDKDYFNEIDSAEKAYWIGFIWCDGYISYRKRKECETFDLKISISEKDKAHLLLFQNNIKSNHIIKFYDIKGFETQNKEARLLICNKIFGKNLYEKYGLKPHRFDTDLLINNIPSQFYKYFIRGIIDAEGSIISKDVEYISTNRKEFSLSITTYENLLNFINKIFIDEGLTATTYKLSKRHEDRDEFCKQLRITGNVIVLKILEWLYNDVNVASLERKYETFINIKQYMKKYNMEIGRRSCKV